MSRSERLFVEINNDLAFRLYHSLIKDRGTESLVFSPFSVATSLAMLFLGARGRTSWQMNSLLRFDEMISFNPHLLFKNVTEALSDAETAACVKQLFVDEVTTPSPLRLNGMLLYGRGNEMNESITSSLTATGRRVVF